MKKLLFTIVFLSVISFVGILKVNALPYGSNLGGWGTTNVFQGQFYSDTGGLMPFYSYDGYSSAGFKCPYLDIVSDFGPLPCYNDRSFEFYNNSSFLVDSNRLCSQGNCYDSSISVVGFVIVLQEKDYFQPWQTYHIELDMGVNIFYFDDIRNILINASNFQNNGNVTGYDVACYKSDASLVNNPYGRDYCRVSYDYTPSATYPNVDFNLHVSNKTLSDLNDQIEWITYPNISVDAIGNFVKYEMRPDQKAFISGGSKTIDNNMYGRIYMPSKYGHYAYDYLAYFDFDRPTVLYENLIKDSKVTLDREYIYYDYSFDYGLPNEVLMLSADEWSIFDVKYPYDTIEFYVSPDTYVDIITPRYSPSNGLTMDFNYINPLTGQLVNQEHVGVSVPNDSSFFDNFGSILSYFKDSILNVGVMFSTFYNYMISDLGMFFLFIFSFGILSAIIIMFR